MPPERQQRRARSHAPTPFARQQHANEVIDIDSLPDCELPGCIDERRKREDVESRLFVAERDFRRYREDKEREFRDMERENCRLKEQLEKARAQVCHPAATPTRPVAQASVKGEIFENGTQPHVKSPDQKADHNGCEITDEVAIA